MRNGVSKLTNQKIINYNLNFLRLNFATCNNEFKGYAKDLRPRLLNVKLFDHNLSLKKGAV